jgi:hypothetical protein
LPDEPFEPYLPDEPDEPDELWDSLDEDARKRANRMTAESIQTMAAGMAHIFRGDLESANLVFSDLSPALVDQTLNAHAFAVAVVEYCAEQLGKDPIVLLEEMAARGALMREAAEGND